MDIDEKTYLCQVGKDVSCGACCGLYNVPDPSRDGLTALLARRSEEFSGLARTESAIDAFALAESRRVPVSARPYPDFHHCPFLGLVGEGVSRAGCLLHPEGAGNRGVDLRGLSWYGGFACRTYFCKSHRGLPNEWKAVVKALVPGWHAYGLVVTETDMLAGFFGLAEKRLGRPLTADFILSHPVRRAAAERFLGLKESWPFRPEGSPRICHYLFEDGLYPDPPIPYEELGAPYSAFDAVLRALGSDFSSAGDLAAAEGILEGIMSRLLHEAR